VKRALKRIGIAVTCLGTVAAAGFTASSLMATARLARKHDAHRMDLPLPAATDAAAAARGKHLAEARYGCAACHGGNLGGGVMLDDRAIGTILGPNLTRGRGSRTDGYAMADWDRIVRHGVKPDGTGALMPSEDFFRMSDSELSDIVAYARSLPPVDAAVPAPSLAPIGKILVAVGKLPLSAERQPALPHPAKPPETAETVAFGEHLAATCRSCHRENLAGGPLPFGPPDWPAAANLTRHDGGLRRWKYVDFERALTEGVSRDGRKLREPMSGVVAGTRGMDPTERRALWSYLQTLAPTATNPG
jgi:mono/diheme cytochrome c family protein